MSNTGDLNILRIQMKSQDFSGRYAETDNCAGSKALTREFGEQIFFGKKIGIRNSRMYPGATENPDFRVSGVFHEGKLIATEISEEVFDYVLKLEADERKRNDDFNKTKARLLKAKNSPRYKEYEEMKFEWTIKYPELEVIVNFKDKPQPHKNVCI